VLAPHQPLPRDFAPRFTRLKAWVSTIPEGIFAAAKRAVTEAQVFPPPPFSPTGRTRIP
jgi:hypothetical protein